MVQGGLFLRKTPLGGSGPPYSNSAFAIDVRGKTTGLDRELSLRIKSPVRITGGRNLQARRPFFHLQNTSGRSLDRSQTSDLESVVQRGCILGASGHSPDHRR